ncbi:N-acetyltransferase [Thalassobacillus devorans]|uniref:N-acetyltransferase n=1 Tax=Thalassobacillus devorans TaxID=279813 RepID=A0ABQ1NJ74_9BACI|nr:GNAT family N-acetyltransferase [Thalassobacillus devorans]NIK27491.1 GNAT superfamily N-acetyltransferase [Thalassobacillus devorans]GGC78154.1 N-acetyltransferase [Thalassobacillus devorans]
MINVREIPVEDTYELRGKRSDQPADAPQYPGDVEEFTFHLGAFENRELTGIASFYMEATPAVASRKQIRLRGMAFDDPAQDLRVATTILHKANRILYHGNVEYLWCEEPKEAQAFYERIGFVPAEETTQGIIFHKKIVKP